MIRIALAAVWLVSLAALATPAWAGFDEGLAAHGRGDYETALREWTPLARQGHADAQYFLGVAFSLGQGVLRDDAVATRWYRRAAEQGHVSAQHQLGITYHGGRGVPRDDAEAAKWYRRAAEQGHAKSQAALAAIYAEGRGVERDDAGAAEWYRRAADQGVAEAQNSLGAMYAAGQGVPRDDAEAVKWYRRAADQGLAAAQTNLGFMYGEGRGVAQDFAEAMKWRRRAAEQGDARGRQWDDHMDAGFKAYVQGNYAEAEKQLAAALGLAERFGPEDPRLAQSLNILAVVYRAQGRYDDAELFHKRALAIREKVLGPEHPEVEQTLSDLGFLYGSQRRFAQALAHFRRAGTILAGRMAAAEKNALTESARRPVTFQGLVHVAYGYAAQQPCQRPALADEALTAAQR